MTQNMADFARGLARLRAVNVPPTTGLAPNEIVDDEVVIGEGTAGWDREERNGRIYLTRRNDG